MKDFFNSIHKKGFGIINADITARKVVEKGKPCLKKIADAFGNDILQSAGALDRKKLGGIVFKDKEKLTLLNSVIYPYIIEDMKADIKRLSAEGKEYIVLDSVVQLIIADVVFDLTVLFASLIDSIAHFGVLLELSSVGNIIGNFFNFLIPAIEYEYFVIFASHCGNIAVIRRHCAELYQLIGLDGIIAVLPGNCECVVDVDNDLLHIKFNPVCSVITEVYSVIYNMLACICCLRQIS
ncbi:dephospho-CoA kinase [uncultured Ruminococcus sp.]|uniref:dephospho-CoA kinase n=1 Tax=uncultured Ruminococcus sp. TaxID=165186 RepID=UPI003459A827